MATLYHIICTIPYFNRQLKRPGKLLKSLSRRRLQLPFRSEPWRRLLQHSTFATLPPSRALATTLGQSRESFEWLRHRKIQWSHQSLRLTQRYHVVPHRHLPLCYTHQLERCALNRMKLCPHVKTSYTSLQVSVKEQQEWKIPPCISNWKNPKVCSLYMYSTCTLLHNDWL